MLQACHQCLLVRRRCRRVAEPDRKPLYPQRFAEIMGGRIALAEDDSEIPSSLKYAMIGALTASEINLTD